jgi:uncharacterized protein (DUF983 family)
MYWPRRYAQQVRLRKTPLPDHLVGVAVAKRASQGHMAAMEEQPIPDSASPTWRAMKRGMRMRCPSCGSTPLYRSYLKVQPVCPSCGAANGEFRVDDAASYFTVLIVGHVVVAPMLAFEVIWDASLVLTLAIALPAVGLVALGGLPFIKGAILGLMSAHDRRARAEAVRPKSPPGPWS